MRSCIRLRRDAQRNLEDEPRPLAAVADENLRTGFFKPKHAWAKVNDLRTIEIQTSGHVLYWPKLDADLYVPSLVKGILGTKQWMAQIGASGDKATTRAESAAARVNGKLGGRPRKPNELETA